MNAVRVTNLNHLHKLSIERKSVYYNEQTRLRPIPASFVIGYPGTALHRMFQGGMYIYRLKKGTK